MRRLGVDVGGTFTDLIYLDDEGGVHVHKVPSTPADPSTATVQGALELCGTAGAEPAGIDQFFHGTTVATNIIIEHDGAEVGLITTQGLPGHPPHRAAQEAAQLVELPGPAVAAVPARAAPPPDAGDRARHRAETARCSCRSTRTRSATPFGRSKPPESSRSRSASSSPSSTPSTSGGRRRSCSRSFPRRSSRCGTRCCRSTASTRASRRSA